MADRRNPLNVYSDNSAYIETVKACEAAASLFSNPRNLLVVCDDNCCCPSTLGMGRNGSVFGNANGKPFARMLLLFTTLPIKLDSVSEWKTWAFNNEISELKIDFLRVGAFDVNYIEGRIRRHCKDWDGKIPDEETPALRKGALVDVSGVQLEKDSPDLLTAMFGSMGEMIMRVRHVRERFDKALAASLGVNGISSTINPINEHKKKITGALENGNGKMPELKHDLVSFPKLLLYGETGVGKTLVSRYLHSVSGEGTSRPVRISIPEYLGKEEDLEYALFGYAKGAYTDGLEQGSPGLLVENMGKVVFLDEIEEANFIIQAKLLAYLDDYRVRPRGCRNSFFCPTLIIAATNCNVEELRSRDFRNDLLARFTDIETVPPLRERKESMDFIIDSLLQQKSINYELKVERIGKYALERLKSHPYPRNFRELEDVLRNACVAAQKDGRDYLCECDIVFD